VGNKNGKNIKIFENVEEAKNGGVIYGTKTIGALVRVLLRMH